MNIIVKKGREKMKEWIIVGDTDKYEACLIKIGRGCKREQMEKELVGSSEGSK